MASRPVPESALLVVLRSHSRRALGSRQILTERSRALFPRVLSGRPTPPRQCLQDFNLERTEFVRASLVLHPRQLPVGHTGVTLTREAAEPCHVVEQFERRARPVRGSQSIPQSTREGVKALWERGRRRSVIHPLSMRSGRDDEVTASGRCIGEPPLRANVAACDLRSATCCPPVRVDRSRPSLAREPHPRGLAPGGRRLAPGSPAGRRS